MPGVVILDTGILGILPVATAKFRALTHATGIVLGSGSVRPGGGKPFDHSACVPKKVNNFFQDVCMLNCLTRRTNWRVDYGGIVLGTPE